MKKYVLLGIIIGLTASLFLFFMKKKRLSGLEFDDFLESSTEVDNLFGDAFNKLPDKL